jgi:hypothetical protein
VGKVTSFFVRQFIGNSLGGQEQRKWWNAGMLEQWNHGIVEGWKNKNAEDRRPEDWKKR